MSIVTGFPKPLLIPFIAISATNYDVPDTLGIIHVNNLTANATWNLPTLSIIQPGALLGVDNSTNFNITLIPYGNDLINNSNSFICVSKSITTIYSSSIGWHARSGLNNLGKSTTNISYGVNSSQISTTGTNNTSFGCSSLSSNTSGSSNTAVGFNSLTALTAGSNNTAVGTAALASIDSNSNNTAVGYSSLNNCTGDNNIAIGYNSGSTLTTGTGNILIGTKVTTGVTSGIGAGTGSALTTNIGNIYIGAIVGDPTDNNIIRIGEGQLVSYLTGVTPITQEIITTISTAGTQLLATEFLGGIISSTVSFILPTQTDLTDNIPGISYNNYNFVIKCLIANTSTASITLTAGSGTTTAYTMTIAANNSKIVYLYYNTTSGSVYY